MTDDPLRGAGIIQEEFVDSLMEAINTGICTPADAIGGLMFSAYNILRVTEPGTPVERLQTFLDLAREIAIAFELQSAPKA